MKKILILLFVFLTLSQTAVLAATDSGTPSTQTSTSSGATDKAKDLLDRVATKVAELVKKERRTYTGSIKSKAAKTSFVITTPDGDVTVTTNEATDFYRVRSGSQSEASFATLKVADDIAAIGTIDSQTKEITARQVIAKIKRTNITGRIEAVDKNILTIKGQVGASIKVDLTDAVTLEKAGSDNKIIKAKEADFAVKQSVFVIGYSPDPKTGTYSVLKALTITP